MRVDGAEFLSEFQRLSQEEKSRNLRKHQAIAAKIKKQKQDVIDRHTAKFCKKVEARIVYPKVGNQGRLDRESVYSMSATQLGQIDSVSDGTVDFRSSWRRGERKIKRLGEDRRGSKKKELRRQQQNSMERSRKPPTRRSGLSLESGSASVCCLDMPGACVRACVCVRLIALSVHVPLSTFWLLLSGIGKGAGCQKKRGTSKKGRRDF